MSGETQAETAAEAAPKKKRSIVKLAVMALVPLLLAGGGYAGWTMFLAAPAEHAAEEGDGHGEEAAPDEMHVAAVDYSIAAETSFSYSLALSEMLVDMCGTRDVSALKAAAEEEAHADGMLVHHSWAAAYRRMGTVTAQSCDMMLSEVLAADNRAYAKAEALAAAAKPAAH